MIRLTPPTVPGFVSSGWGADRSYRGGWHAGLDFPAAKGSPMLAAADGVIAFVKNYSNSYAGKYPVVDHGGGIFTRYLHADTVTKKVGDRVRRGEVIGTVGTTGTTSSAPHVHFDVKLKEPALSEYARRFGTPTNGFAAPLAPWGVGVPTEPLMDKATWKPGVKEKSASLGVGFYSGIAIGGILLSAGAGWFLYKYLISR